MQRKELPEREAGGGAPTLRYLHGYRWRKNKGDLYNSGAQLGPMGDGLGLLKGKNLKAGASVSRTGCPED